MENAIDTVVDEELYSELVQAGEEVVETTSPRQPLQELRVQLVSLKETKRRPAMEKAKPRPRTKMLNWLTSSTLQMVEDSVLGEADERQCGLRKESSTYSKRRV